MKQVKTSQLCRNHLQESWTFKTEPSGRGQQGSDQEMMILWFHVLEIIASINILTNSPYWAFQLLVGQAMAIPPGTEFPVGNYFQLKNSCDHPRFTASHSSPSHRSWVKSLCTFPVSIIKINKITLKWFLEASPTPRLPHPAGRTGQTGSFHVFPSSPAVIDEILNAREWRCCRWLAQKIHCTQIPSSRCNYFLWGKWFLLPVLQAGNAKWSGWEKCYLKQSTRVSLRWEKKGGKIKQEGKEKEFKSMGKSSSIK